MNHKNCPFTHPLIWRCWHWGSPCGQHTQRGALNHIRAWQPLPWVWDKHNERFILGQLYPAGHLSQKPLILRICFQTNSQRRRSGVSTKLQGLSVWDRGQEQCLPAPALRFTELGERSSALLWRSLWLMGLCSLEIFWMILDLDTRQGRKWAGVPWLGEALQSLPRERERGEEEEKGRMATAPLSVLSAPISN